MVLPSWKGCNGEEWDVTGEQHAASSAQRLLLKNLSSLAKGEVYLSRHPSCGCRIQRVGLALVTVSL